MFCHSSVDHAAISVMPVAHSVGCVKKVVRTSGSPVVVGVVVVDEDRLDTIDDEVGREELDVVGVDVVFVTPDVEMPIEDSWP
jgi:hypothetical protein